MAVATVEQAMDDETQSLKAKCPPWTLVDLPLGWHPITSKWVLKKKFRLDGFVDHYKAYLVA